MISPRTIAPLAAPVLACTLLTGCAGERAEQGAPAAPNTFTPVLPSLTQFLIPPSSDDQAAAERYWRERPPGGLWVGTPPRERHDELVLGDLGKLLVQFQPVGAIGPAREE